MKNRHWYEQALGEVTKNLELVCRDIDDDIIADRSKLDRRNAIRKLTFAIHLLALADEDDLIDLDSDLDGDRDG